ncbi:MAG: NAD-dependent epimerase/dehydratase family protein [Chloroflexi bacterium]|nr:NAD-dependent epimerase/dehydratase family protein [Chloroflexota bacterium]MCC6895639.1 NAD-dependent epimerase/dehydratase family protein [Anaerolineae bacterium]
MTTRALVTGAGGFLGSHLYARLSSLGWDVVGTARKPSDRSMLEADVMDKSRLREIAAQHLPQIVFHIAALTPAAAPKAILEDYLRVNVIGTTNVLDVVREAAPNARVVLVTSSAMFGQTNAPDGVIDETSPLNPVNPYGVSKAAQHHVGYQYTIQHKLDVIRVCPFNLIGYGLPLGLVASDFARQIVAVERGEQEPVIRVGDLSAKRDFLDVEDAVHALIALVDKGILGESYNLASGYAIPVADLLNKLIDLSSTTVTAEIFPNAVKNTVPIQIGSYAKLAAATGWQPQISLEQSLANVLAYWRTVKNEEIV